jgi:ABC-2 type transport system permease protein
MWGPLFALVRKDLKLFFKDPRGVVLIFLMPFMFIVVMSLALRGSYGGADDTPIRVLGVSEDRGGEAAKVLQQLDDTDGFEVTTSRNGRPLTRGEAAELVVAGDSGIAVLFPAEFSEILQAGPAVEGRQAVVQVMVDPATSVQFVQPIVGTLRGLVERATYLTMVPKGVDLMIDWIAPETSPTKRAMLRAVSAEATAGLSSSSGESPVTLQRTAPPGMRVERLPDSFQQNVPGYTVFGIFWIVSLIAASIHEEKRQGTFRRLLVAPLGRSSMLAGKLLPYFLINLVQAAVMLGAASLIFGLDLGRSPLGLFVVAASAAAAASGLGVLVSAFARTEAQIGGLTSLLLLTLSAIGGCFVPRVVMPDWLRSVGMASPHAWALDGFQDILVRGYGLVEVLPRAGVLFGFALAFFVVGSWRFRFE